MARWRSGRRTPFVVLSATLILWSPSGSSAAEGTGNVKDQGPHRGHHGEAGRDRFRNPRDTAGYIAAQESPARAEWQKPEQVLDTLGLQPGETVCDIGAGPGYFSLRAAKRVGATGRVLAVDVDARILEVLRQRIERVGATNVTPVLGLATDPLLPPAGCDTVLVIDVYHHFPDRPRYLRLLTRLLRAGGRIAAIDWHKRPTAFGPAQDHRVSREEFLADATAAGLKVAAEPTFLPHQYFVILTMPVAKAAPSERK